MSNVIWFLIGVGATILVEFVAVVVVAVRRILAARKVSGQNSREPIKEDIVHVLKQE